MNIFVKLMICVSVVLSLINISYANNLDDILSALQKAKFSEKEDLLSQIAEIKSNKSLIILKHIESGNLYYTKSEKITVYAEKIDKNYKITDILTGNNLGQVKKNKIKRISLNNKLRKHVRVLIAKASLVSEDKNIRINAAKTIFETSSFELLPLIDSSLVNEKNKSVTTQRCSKIVFDTINFRL